MFGSEEDLDEGLVRELLRKKRVLVIVDGLSERSAEMQNRVCKIFQKAAVNALVITSRSYHEFESKSVVTLTPRDITNVDLENFVSEYFKQPEVHPDLSLIQATQLTNLVVGVFRNRIASRVLTPLIVTLIADQAVELWRRSESLSELTGSAADAIIAYLDRVNPKDADTPNRVSDEIMVRAARILAKCCLSDRHAPGDFDRYRARAELAESECDGQPSDVIARLIQNGVLEEIHHLGISFLKFNLDPVAEYLAAMYRLDILRDDKQKWENWLQELKVAPNYPAGMQGFLGALEDCVSSHGAHFGVPDDIDLPWSGKELPSSS